MPGVRGANSYLLTEGPITLIDAGLPGSGKAVVEYMSALGLEASRLERILITHRHPDHAGGAGALREATGARVYAHRGDVNVVDDRAALESRVGAGALVDIVLEGGEELDGGIRVVHCGGHTQGSVAYYLPAATSLFLGDMAINNIDRLSRPIAFSNEDNAAYESGLARLTTLDAGTGYFGHGPALTDGLREALLALKGRPRSPAWRAALSLAWLRVRRRRGRD